MTRAETPRTVVPRCRCGFVGKASTPGMAAYSLRRHSCAKYRDAAESTVRMLARHAAIDRTPKPCLHKHARHVHGERNCYVLDKCRCLPCAASNATSEGRRVRQIAYGRWEPYVDAAPAVAHVRALMAAGVGIKAVSRRSGVSTGVLSRLLYGRPYPDGRRTFSTKMRRETAQKLLGVTAELEAGAPTDGTGTRRRLQALVTVGWSLSELGRRLGMAPNNMTKTVRSDQVLVSTARAVAALYDELWDQAPPESNHRERISASRARGHAARHGWLAPLAWDDDTLDDPAAEPATTTSVRRHGNSKLPPAEDLQFLLDNGESIAAIASRFGVSEDGVSAALRRSTAA